MTLPPKAPTWVVGADEGGVRLDKFLAAVDRLGSRRRSSTALERRRVFVNGREVTLEAAGRQLRVGDRVAVWSDRPGWD